MNKAKLIKKDSPLQAQLRQRKNRKARKQQPTPTRKAFEMTTEWLKSRREAPAGAREAFAALFSKTDPQSA